MSNEPMALAFLWFLNGMLVMNLIWQVIANA